VSPDEFQSLRTSQSGASAHTNLHPAWLFATKRFRHDDTSGERPALRWTRCCARCTWLRPLTPGADYGRTHHEKSRSRVDSIVQLLRDQLQCQRDHYLCLVAIGRRSLGIDSYDDALPGRRSENEPESLASVSAGMFRWKRYSGRYAFEDRSRHLSKTYMSSIPTRSGCQNHSMLGGCRHFDTVSVIDPGRIHSRQRGSFWQGFELISTM
jgi:hypothetical protein